MLTVHWVGTNRRKYSPAYRWHTGILLALALPRAAGKAASRSRTASAAAAYLKYPHHKNPLPVYYFFCARSMASAAAEMPSLPDSYVKPP